MKISDWNSKMFNFEVHSLSLHNSIKMIVCGRSVTHDIVGSVHIFIYLSLNYQWTSTKYQKLLWILWYEIEKCKVCAFMNLTYLEESTETDECASKPLFKFSTFNFSDHAEKEDR